MSWTNYHGHCHYCDGKGSIEEYVKKAIDYKMPVLGISSHAPVPFETTWTMPGDKLPLYLEEINKLKSRYKDDIELLTSLEVDYIPGLTGPLNKQIVNAKLDYVIGSVHYVDCFDNGIYWSIDNNNSEFEKGLNEIFNNDMRKVVNRYFFLQQQMCETQKPDIIGHIDKVRMQNVLKPYFNEHDSWYLRLVYDTLKLAAEKEIIVEINTKYLKRSGVLFPAKEHFKWMKNQGVRVTINSDAHNPEFLISGFDDVALLLIEAGYKELWEWNGSGFAPFSFNKNGLIF